MGRVEKTRIQATQRGLFLYYVGNYPDIVIEIIERRIGNQYDLLKKLPKNSDSPVEYLLSPISTNALLSPILVFFPPDKIIPVIPIVSSGDHIQ